MRYKTLFPVSLVIILVSLAFTPANLSEKVINSPNEEAYSVVKTTITAEVALKEKIKNIYTDFNLTNSSLPDFKAFQKGMLGYFELLNNGQLKKNILTIIDFSLPSTQKRLWVLDMNSHEVLFHTYVAHGQGSGINKASQFSNRENSHQSSLGFYLTAETYMGKHGFSMRLDGLEKGFNSNARNRYIVMHPADYATSQFIHKTGRLGRSWGCPAVPPKFSKQIIQTIKGKSCFFVYYPSENYLENSKFLNS